MLRNYPYKLDLTGVDPQNKITEVLDVVGSPIGVAILSNGSFFADSIVVEYNGTELTKGLENDYTTGDVEIHASSIVGAPITNTILINDPSMTPITVTVQLVGGQFLSILPTLNEHTGLPYSGVVDFETTVINKPELWNPTEHGHSLNDVFGWERVVDSLNNIRDAITNSNIREYEILIEWVTKKVNELPTVTCSDIIVGDPIKAYMTYGMFMMAHKHPSLREYNLSITRPDIDHLLVTIDTVDVPDGTLLSPVGYFGSVRKLLTNMIVQNSTCEVLVDVPNYLIGESNLNFTLQVFNQRRRELEFCETTSVINTIVPSTTTPIDGIQIPTISGVFDIHTNTFYGGVCCD